MKPEERYAPLIAEMRQKGNATDAEAMRKYMRNRYEFFGAKKPLREEITGKFTKANGLPQKDEVESVVTYLWEQPQRELQYYAMFLADKTAKKADKDIIKLYEYMIVTKSWWDTVDYIAANPVGKYFRKYPSEINQITGKWMNSGNVWLQRTALLFQLKYKKDTDFELLSRYILQLQNEKEFFIRKAIGWSLREYSKTDPQKVTDFVENSGISDFSKKEALKWLKNKDQLKQP